jgi:CheY-like chemotaxis protein
MHTEPRVLVVCDEPALCRPLVRDLAERGHDAVSVPDGVRALSALARAEAEARPFGRLVVNSRLSDIHGRKLLAIVRSRQPQLPVVLMGQVAAAAPDPRSAVLAAPVSTDALLAAFAALEGAPPADDGAGGPGWCEPRAYVFVQLEPDADPGAVYGALRALPDVRRVDAVRGSADLVLRLDGPVPAAIDAFVRERVAPVPGVAAAVARHVGQPELPAGVRRYFESYERRLPADLLADGRATAYAVVEIAPPAMAALYPSLFFLDEAVEAAATARGEAVVLLLQAADHGHIRTLLNEKVRYTDGVLRIDELMVVDLLGAAPAA